MYHNFEPTSEKPADRDYGSDENELTASQILSQPYKQQDCPEGSFAHPSVGVLPTAALTFVAAQLIDAAINLHLVVGVTTAVVKSFLDTGNDLDVGTVFQRDGARAHLTLRRLRLRCHFDDRRLRKGRRALHDTPARQPQNQHECTSTRQEARAYGQPLPRLDAHDSKHQHSTVNPSRISKAPRRFPPCRVRPPTSDIRFPTDDLARELSVHRFASMEGFCRSRVRQANGRCPLSVQPARGRRRRHRSPLRGYHCRGSALQTCLEERRSLNASPPPESIHLVRLRATRLRCDLRRRFAERCLQSQSSGLRARSSFPRSRTPSLSHRSQELAHTKPNPTPDCSPSDGSRFLAISRGLGSSVPTMRESRGGSTGPYGPPETPVPCDSSRFPRVLDLAGRRTGSDFAERKWPLVALGRKQCEKR